MPKDKYMMLQNHNITIIRLLLLLLLKISYFVSQFVIQNLLNVQLISHDFFFKLSQIFCIQFFCINV